jgi:RimJ/RimL family protein N-acetyltransferase
MNLQPTLENQLLRLSPLTEDDFEPLFAIASDPLIWEQHPNYDRYKREVFQIYFDSAIESKGAFLVTDKRTNKLIGCTRFYEYDPEHSSIAIGYTFLIREYWGGDYNRSMKGLLLDYAFKFVDSVRFHIGANNLRSQKGTLKLGVRKIAEKTIGDTSHFEYEIRKEEWHG